jgi:hypothetical protein
MRPSNRVAPPQPEVRILMTQERPPVNDLMTWAQEYALRLVWLRSHSFAVMDFNATRRRFGPTTRRNPLHDEPPIHGINDTMRNYER